MTEEESVTSESRDIQTEYYMETLISDAFKGKGFQKITELFEDKVVCSSQRYSKVLLNQMDRLVNKELDRNEFKHVSLLMKCIQHFCKNDCQEGTLEFLNISGINDPSISALVEDFYDTSLVICKCNCEDGKKQLLDLFLFRLGLIVTEKWAVCHLRLEALRTINCILDNISREDKKRLHSSEEMCVLAQDFARTILDAGDYDIQVALSEALCRMMVKKFRDGFVQRWFVDNFLAEAFKNIKDKEFETDCRKFLNCLNTRLKDKSGVYTFPCITVFANMDELQKPQDDKLEHFWIDFNVGSQCVSLYINNKEGSLWDSVRLLKNAINSYSLQEIDGKQIFSIYLKEPLSINNKDITKVKIYFELEHDIHGTIEKVFGTEVNMITSAQPEIKEAEKVKDVGASQESNTVVTTDTTFQQWKSNQLNPRLESASDILCSQTSDQSSATVPMAIDGDFKFCFSDDFDIFFSFKKISSETVSTQKSLLITDSQEVLAESVPCETVIAISEDQTSVIQDGKSDAILPDIIDLSSDAKQELKQTMQGIQEAREPSSPDQQPTQKKSTDFYEFQCSSDSLTHDQVSKAKRKILVEKSTHRLSPTSRTTQNSPNTRQSATYKSHLFSESNGAASHSHSERSWILDYHRKSSTKSADYSRKKPRIKGKLKVLPLSSESSDAEKKERNRRSMSRFSSFKKVHNPERGKAKSLSELKLPGVSALLTPGDSRLQSTKTVDPSDVDEQDIMDPLQESSSPEFSKVIESSPLELADDSHNVSGSGPSRKNHDVLNNTFNAGILEDAKRKRKHDETYESGESVFKPRKLFGSSEKKEKKTAVDSDDVFYSEPQDLGEASVISAFESFTKDLKKKFMTRYKVMENRAQNVLKTSHQKVSTLLGKIHQCRLHKLHHFHKIVVHELSSLETEAQALKELEKETLDFWEEQHVKMNTFCNSQQQRIKSMDSAFEETMSNLANVIQKTTMEEAAISNIEDGIQSKLIK